MTTTETKLIDADRVLELLAEVVAGHEDYVYERPKGVLGPLCMYAHGDRPGCIAGHVLHRLGFSVDELAGFDGPDSDAIGTVRGLREAGVLPMLTDGAVEVLNRAQEFQDKGYPWRHALAEAREVKGE